MMEQLLDADLASMFGLDPDTSADDAAPAASTLCGKCNGRGTFVSYAGRVVGKCYTCNGTGMAPCKPVAAMIDVVAIETAFVAAEGHGIKTPKLRLADFVFSRAPHHGRNAGAVYVKSGSEYLGKVARGQFHPSPACDDGTKARVIEVAARPHDAAKQFGMATGVCSCCGRTLTNAESIELGIGPICRGNFGW